MDTLGHKYIPDKPFSLVPCIRKAAVIRQGHLINSSGYTVVKVQRGLFTA
jgi:hypothetical protein